MTNEEYNKHDETNRLIAEFMGLETVVRHPRTGEWSQAHFDFHHSWDCLMGVIEKIQREGFKTSIENNWCSIDGCTDETDGIYFETKSGNTSMIAATYEAILSFIQWYNQTTIDNAREEENISDWD